MADAQPVVFEPAPIRCPWCGSSDTRSYATRKRVQYRRCRAPACRRTFKVMRRPRPGQAPGKGEARP